MNNSKYRGVVVPMVTPVTQDGQLDIEAVKRIIDFFAQNNVSPLLMGTTGEGNSVSQADGQLFVETAVQANAQHSTPVTIYSVSFDRWGAPTSSKNSLEEKVSPKL